MIKSCDQCQKHANSQPAETLLPHIISTLAIPQHRRIPGVRQRMAFLTIKNLLKKSRDFHLALLMLRSTPITGSTCSPAELLYGRKIANNLPSNITPTITSYKKGGIRHMGTCAHGYSARDARTLSKLPADSSVHYRDPVSKTWKPATITTHRDETRSYDLHTDEGTDIRRNPRDIRPNIPAEPA